MDRMHVLGAAPAATAAAGGVHVAFSPAIPFGPVASFGPVVSFDYRVWWYDVHQVEGAV